MLRRFARVGVWRQDRPSSWDLRHRGREGLGVAHGVMERSGAVGGGTQTEMAGGLEWREGSQPRAHSLASSSCVEPGTPPAWARAAPPPPPAPPALA